MATLKILIFALAAAAFASETASPTSEPPFQVLLSNLAPIFSTIDGSKDASYHSTAESAPVTTTPASKLAANVAARAWSPLSSLCPSNKDEAMANGEAWPPTGEYATHPKRAATDGAQYGDINGRASARISSSHPSNEEEAEESGEERPLTGECASLRYETSTRTYTNRLSSSAEQGSEILSPLKENHVPPQVREASQSSHPASEDVIEPTIGFAGLNTFAAMRNCSDRGMHPCGDGCYRPENETCCEIFYPGSHRLCRSNETCQPDGCCPANFPYMCGNWQNGCIDPQRHKCCGSGKLKCNLRDDCNLKLNKCCDNGTKACDADCIKPWEGVKCCVEQLPNGTNIETACGLDGLCCGTTCCDAETQVCMVNGATGEKGCVYTLTLGSPSSTPSHSAGRRGPLRARSVAGDDGTYYGSLVCQLMVMLLVFAAML